jgi:hypothetical protein
MISETSLSGLSVFTDWLNENRLEFFSCLLNPNPMNTQSQEVRINHNLEFLKKKQQEAYRLLALVAEQLVQEQPTHNARAAE